MQAVVDANKSHKSLLEAGKQQRTDWSCVKTVDSLSVGDPGVELRLQALQAKHTMSKCQD